MLFLVILRLIDTLPRHLLWQPRTCTVVCCEKHRLRQKVVVVVPLPLASVTAHLLGCHLADESAFHQLPDRILCSVFGTVEVQCDGLDAGPAQIFLLGAAEQVTVTASGIGIKS